MARRWSLIGRFLILYCPTAQGDAQMLRAACVALKALAPAGGRELGECCLQVSKATTIHIHQKVALNQHAPS
jgi:hypothetical protein